MDFESILNDKLPDSIDKSVIGTVANALNKGLREELQSIFGKKINTLAKAEEHLNAVNEKLEETQGLYDERDTKIKELEAELETEKGNTTTATAALDEFKAGIAKKETDATITAFVEKGLSAYKNEKGGGLLVKQFMDSKHFDLEQFKPEKNSKGEITGVKNLDEIVKRIAETHVDYQTMKSKEATDIGSSGENLDGKIFDLSKMTHDEINANWDAISKSGALKT